MSGASLQTPRGSQILPNNATALERILTDVGWDELSKIDTDIIRRVVDPATCPERLLPYLAWALSVDVWDPDWPIERRRAVIAASPEIHRIKGTRKAIALSLAVLGYSGEITEWWEATPPARRGTFKVRMDYDGDFIPFSPDDIRNIAAAIGRAKPKSRVFGLEIPAKTRTPVVIAGAVAGVRHVDILPHRCWQASRLPVLVTGHLPTRAQAVTILPPIAAPSGAIEAPVVVAGFLEPALRAALIQPRPPNPGPPIECEIHPGGLVGTTVRDVVINPFGSDESIGRNCDAGFIIVPRPDHLDLPMNITGFIASAVRSIVIAPR